MKRSLCIFLAYIIVLLFKVQTFESEEYDNTLLKKLIKRLGETGIVGSQYHINVLFPENHLNSSMAITFHDTRKNYLMYKSLFQIRYMSVLKLDQNIIRKTNRSGTLFLLPFALDNVSKICELIITPSMSQYDAFLMYVNDYSKTPLEMVLPRNCDLSYSSNFYIFYKMNNFTFYVEEVYKTAPNSPFLLQNKLLTYDAGNDTIAYLSPKEKWKRRSDLRGIEFQGFVKSFEPYVINKKTPPITDGNSDTESKNTFEGMFIEVMRELEVMLNFSVTMSLPHKMDYNEVINRISNGEKDMAIGVFSYTYERSFAVDFSVAIHEDRSALLYLKKNFNVKWGSYVRPFYLETWSAVAAHVIISALAIVIFSSVNKDFTSSNYFFTTTAKAFIFSLYSTIAKRFPSEPDSIACRIAFVTISLAGFIMISLYRAMLGASLAITKDHPPINSMREVLESDYDIMAMGGTSYETYFTKADNKSYLYSISKKKLILENSYSDNPITAMLLNVLKTRRSNILVYVDNVETPSYHPDLACHFSHINEEYATVGAGFIFPKNWPFTQVINTCLLTMLEDGSFERIKKRWLPKKMLCDSDRVDPSNLLDIFTLGVTLVVGGILAMILFLIELSYKRNFA